MKDDIAVVLIDTLKEIGYQLRQIKYELEKTNGVLYDKA